MTEIEQSWQEEFDKGFKEGSEKGVLIGQILFAQRYLAFTGEELAKKSLDELKSILAKMIARLDEYQEKQRQKT
jgi:hypothetical protein